MDIELTKWLKRIINSEDDYSYEYASCPIGLTFSCREDVFNSISDGKAGDLITLQHTLLSMLAEEGMAEEIPNGFIVTSEVVVSLDKDTIEVLKLPKTWSGQVAAEINGLTENSNFNVNLKASTEIGTYTQSYKVDGPFISFATEPMLLSKSLLSMFESYKSHQQSEKSEYDNLSLILALQNAKKAGVKINLGHFEKLHVKSPDTISISAEFDLDGNLELTPFMGQHAGSARINKVLGQLRSEHSTALKVDDEIILFNEEKLKAVREIIRCRKIDKSQVKEFLAQPTAFIDANLVNLDVGFSARVRGATVFKHAYFGETDGSTIDWFGKKSQTENIHPIFELTKTIKEESALSGFETLFNTAVSEGITEVEYESKTYDITDTDHVRTVLDNIRSQIARPEEVPEPSDSEKAEGFTEEEADEDDQYVVDIQLNDEDVDIASPILNQAINEVLYPADNLDWSNYLRQPYKHQSVGVRWILGLSTLDGKGKGALLADDMGLGKTFMGLSAIDHLYQIADKENKTKKPTLIVAPLSLLEIWRDEISETFRVSPFKDVVILQSSADLSKYKIKNTNLTVSKTGTDEEIKINYALKIGADYGLDRLDIPARIVITTYQTLRDYQFSLCMVDWGVVVFDEAQNIKNPNAIQTRAAKGLKADFNLVVTGTPVENSLADFWCLIDTAIPGYLDSYQVFRKQYVTPILQAASDEIENVRAQVGRSLRLKIGSLMLRRTKEDTLSDLPKKNIYVGIQGDGWNYMKELESIMDGFQLKIYDATLEDNDSTDVNHALASLQRLRDVSLHPKLTDRGLIPIPSSARELNSLFNESGKIRSLISTLDQIRKRNQKCIIFCVNKRLQTFLSLSLTKLYKLPHINIINGDTKAVSKQGKGETRKSMIAKFEAATGFNIIVMSPIAAGVGLTIVGANNVIHVERHWNPAKEAQATDRVYRIGQKKDVNVYIPTVHHPIHESFDVNLHKLLTKKTLLKDAIVTPEQIIPNPEGFNEHALSPEYELQVDDLRNISWEQFEAFSAEIILQHNSGKECWLTKTGSDGGADAVVVHDNNASLIQCKHTTTARYDGYKAIQEVYAAKVIYEKNLDTQINSLIFITNAKNLSPRSRELAKEYSVEIISYKEIEVMLSKHKITLKHVLSRLGKKRLSI